MRTKLHHEGWVPKVNLSGVGHLKSLSFGDMVIHKRPKEAAVCMRFAEVYKEWSGNVEYRGESLAGFTSMIFDDMCQPKKRHTLTQEERTIIFAKVDCARIAKMRRPRSTTTSLEQRMDQRRTTWWGSVLLVTRRRPPSTNNGSM